MDGILKPYLLFNKGDGDEVVLLKGGEGGNAIYYRNLQAAKKEVAYIVKYVDQHCLNAFDPRSRVWVR